MNINWYPGHMTKAKRELQDKIKLIDMVVEVLDARAPYSSVNPDFEKMFVGKQKMYVLNKADMADDGATKRWIAYFKARGDFAVSFSAKGGNSKSLQNDILRCAEPIYQKFAAKGMKKTVRALVCGIPNVGKSAVINRLLGTNKLKEGNKPGVTRALAWAKLSPYLELMDSPGILWPKIENENQGAILALIGCIKTEVLDEERLSWHLVNLLKTAWPHMLTERYKLDTLKEDSYEILADISKSRGFLLKGGEIDCERGSKTLLEEFRNGKLGRITLEKPSGND